MTTEIKSLVTGAAGFTGSFLVKHLLSKGVPVRGMVRNEKAAEELRSLGAEAVLGDLTDPDSLRAAVSGVDVVYHIAALFRQAGLPASEFHRVKVEGTRALLDCSVEAGVKKFIHCSTVGVLGNVEQPPADEQTPYNPGDPYQESKMQGELIALDYFKSGKLGGCVIRPGMIYGPGDQRTLKLFKGLAQGRFLYVGSGTALVHFVDVRDLAEAFRLAATAPNVDGEIFIISGETCLPLKELVGVICTLLGVPEPRLHLPVKPMQLLGTLCEAVCTPLRINPPIFRRRVDFFTKNRSFNSSKAQALLGYKPSKHLVEELIDIIESYVSSGDIELANDKPINILRTLDGRISAWDSRASTLYGWRRDQAVGQVSHALFNTKFPSELQTINHHLEQAGQWHGALVHQDKDGKTVEVESNWRLLGRGTGGELLVLECNRPISRGPKTPFTSLSALAFASPVHEVLSDLLDLVRSAPMSSI